MAELFDTIFGKAFTEELAVAADSDDRSFFALPGVEGIRVRKIYEELPTRCVYIELSSNSTLGPLESHANNYSVRIVSPNVKTLSAGPLLRINDDYACKFSSESRCIIHPSSYFGLMNPL